MSSFGFTRDFMQHVFRSIEHGDDVHRKWLRDKCELLALDLEKRTHSIGMSLRWLQQNLPWQGSYTEAFETGPEHNHFTHGVLHLTKAVGKLAAAIEPLDHHNGEVMGHVSTTLADVVICALRLANVHPEIRIDLEKCVIERLKEKNELPADWPNEERS